MPEGEKLDNSQSLGLQGQGDRVVVTVSRVDNMFLEV